MQHCKAFFFFFNLTIPNSGNLTLPGEWLSLRALIYTTLPPEGQQENCSTVLHDHQSGIAMAAKADIINILKEERMCQVSLSSVSNGQPHASTIYYFRILMQAYSFGLI